MYAKPARNDDRQATTPGSEPFSLCDLDYELPDELIARTPAVRRDAARLLAVDRSAGTVEDRGVSDLPDLLRPGDLLVLNDTRVIPAKFTAHRTTGGKVRGLFLGERAPGVWRVMLEGSRRLRVGERIAAFASDSAAPRVTFELLERQSEGHWIVRADASEPAASVLERIGETPLPPYIGRKADRPDPASLDRERYQTVYASAPGAVAAPTAGLHFTNDLLERIRARGVGTAFVTLHVGLGTFKPISAARLADHMMHNEWYALPGETADAINECRERGGRIVAVGTTGVRVLESAVRTNDEQGAAASLARPGTSREVGKGAIRIVPREGWTDLFIYPPYRFRIVGALLTNFHLPRSTLLALVMAFAGVALTRQAYDHAIAERYRFYSYGDAMIVT